MKRQVKLKCLEDRYILEESNVEIFSIRFTDLKFDSVSFYNGVYKKKTPAIELENCLSNDPLKKGNHIFNWLNEIIADVNAAFPELYSEEGNDNDNENVPAKIIPLYDFSACAGEGFFLESDIAHTDISDITGRADYAVRISGTSMEPTIMDGSIVYVQKVDTLESKDIGLFIVNGDVMCKRFIKNGRGFKLVPENDKYLPLTSKEIGKHTSILGKVIS